MTTIQKVVLGVLAVGALVFGGLLVLRQEQIPEQSTGRGPEMIVADLKTLTAEVDALQSVAGADCTNRESVLGEINTLEKQLADLLQERKEWLDSVPELPELTPEMMGMENPLGRPGSEVPELTPDVPPLPDVDIEVLGSEAPELTSDVPPLPDVDIVVTDGEYIPELPHIDGGNPGSEVPELTSDVPPLPEIDEMNIINPNEYIFQMDDYARAIEEKLQALKTLCHKEESPVKKKVISDQCSDACKRHKDCAEYTEDVTPADLEDAYTACMEECATWPKEMITCINRVDIRTPNDCVSFVQCQLPQYYEKTYAQ